MGVFPPKHRKLGGSFPREEQVSLPSPPCPASRNPRLIEALGLGWMQKPPLSLYWSFSEPVPCLFSYFTPPSVLGRSVPTPHLQRVGGYKEVGLAAKPVRWP